MLVDFTGDFDFSNLLSVTKLIKAKFLLCSAVNWILLESWGCYFP